MKIVNSYAQLPAHFYAQVTPSVAPKPLLLAWNEALAEELGLSELATDYQQLTQIVSGNSPLPGGTAIALAYAGHQFGNFVPQLGDGRATMIGEVIRPHDNMRFDLQLKGSGQTPFSRNGDGKSSLGPVIREFLLCEAMHQLGVPTTRALAAVSTGEDVIRQTREPGGILTRVASSHIRVGTFQYFAAREDKSSLKKLTDYAIDRHDLDAAASERPVLAFFAGVVARQANLIANWMALGFIHGVMNTDNCAISGETLDYGPCAFMDEFDINKVFSSIDRNGRYAFGQQANMAHWNLSRLAECLMLLDGDQDDYQSLLETFATLFEQHYFELMSKKLGLSHINDSDTALITAWLQHLQDNQLDYSLSFTQLAESLDNHSSETRFGEFETRWLQRIEQQSDARQQALKLMSAHNPVIIPRNHQIARAIDAAFEDDFSIFNELRQVLAQPYKQQAGYEHYTNPPQQHERVKQTFCGT